MSFETLRIFLIILGLETIEGKKQCFLPGDDPPYFECEYYEDCCNRRCCPKPTGEQDLSYLWILVVFLVIAFICFCKYMCKPQENQPESTDGSRRFRILRRSRRNQQVNNYSNIENTVTPTTTALAPVSDTDVGISQVHDSHHPITPPPSYEAALDAPVFDPNNRIPSYEDVMLGRVKTSNS